LPTALRDYQPSYLQFTNSLIFAPMQILSIKKIETHSFHGCLPAERKVGTRFSTDLEFVGDFSKAMADDDLSQTVDYVLVHQLVREEMSIPANLIEHVAQRIMKRMQETFPIATYVKVSITKFNPPVNGQLGEAVFTVMSS
jgi:dihydroneopterin aldolase